MPRILYLGMGFLRPPFLMQCSTDASNRFVRRFHDPPGRSLSVPNIDDSYMMGQCRRPFLYHAFMQNRMKERPALKTYAPLFVVYKMTSIVGAIGDIGNELLE